MSSRQSMGIVIGLFILVLVVMLLILWLMSVRVARRSKKLVATCTQETMGTLVKVTSARSGRRWYVQYRVYDQTYMIKEYIGQVREDGPDGKVSYKDCLRGAVGTRVEVMYDPVKPFSAYIKKNKI